MIHLDEDKLLQYVLKTLGEAEYEEARGHIAGCASCRLAQRRMHDELGRIASLHMDVELPDPPGLSGNAREPYRKWRWAIGLAAGFILGFLSATISVDSHPNPVPQRLVPAVAPASRVGYASCQALEIRDARR